MSTRHARASARAARIALTRDHEQEEVCAMCQETLYVTSPTHLLAVTVCDHVFHGECWNAYVQHHYPVVASWDEIDAHTRLIMVLQAAGGPPCPLCARAFPMNHMIPRIRMEPRSPLEGIIDLEGSLNLALVRREDYM